MVEVLAYPKLSGAKEHQTAATLCFSNQAGIKLKQVRITLAGGEAIAEAGALRFMLGLVLMESKVGGVAGLGKAMMAGLLLKELKVRGLIRRRLGSGPADPTLSVETGIQGHSRMKRRGNSKRSSIKRIGKPWLSHRCKVSSREAGYWARISDRT